MAAGEYSQVDSGYGAARHMVTIGDRTYLVAASGNLWWVDGKGGYQQLTPDWKPIAMVNHKGGLYIFDAVGPVYKVNLEDGSYEKVTVGWEATTAACSNGDVILVIANGSLYRLEV